MSDFADLLGAIAPTLGKAALSMVPGGTVAAGLISTVSQAIFGHPNASEEDLTQALKNLPPDQRAALIKADNDYKLAIASIPLEAEKAELATGATEQVAVNETMRVEDTTRKFSWRDYWGYVSGTGFGVVTLLVCYISEEAVRTSHPEMLSQIPAIVGAFTALFGVSSVVLGVVQGIQTHHEGMAERETASKAKSDS